MNNSKKLIEISKDEENVYSPDQDVLLEDNNSNLNLKKNKLKLVKSFKSKMSPKGFYFYLYVL